MSKGHRSTRASPIGSNLTTIESRAESLPQKHLRDLPSVSSVLAADAASIPLERFGRFAFTGPVHAALDDARTALRSGTASIPGAEDLALQALARLDKEDRSGLRSGPPRSSRSGSR